MLDADCLGSALKTAVSMRDKVVVVRIDAEALRQPPQIAATAQTLALLRALELRPLVVLSGATAAEALHSGQQLLLSIQRHGQKGVVLSATGSIAVKKLMVAAPAVAATANAAATWSGAPELVPMWIPLVDSLLITQLCSLRYLPILLLPAVDDAGGLGDYPADEVAAALGRFLEASQLVFWRQSESTLPPVLAEAPGRPVLVLPAAAPERLLDALFQPR